MAKLHRIYSLLVLPFFTLALLGAASPRDGKSVDVSYVLPPTLSLHEPVRLTITISNGTSESAHLDLGQDRKGAYILALTRPDGARIELPEYSRDGISIVGTIVLKPSEKFTEILLLNEWYPFGIPGHYWVRVRMAHPILVGPNSTPIMEPGFEGEVQIEPRNAERLEDLVKKLTQRIVDSTSYAGAAEAAQALSYTMDSITVPYLDKALHAGKLVEPIAIAGLERIANHSAIAALVSSLQQDNPDVATQSRAALVRIGQRTSDPGLKRQIEQALEPQHFE
jgi:hypothetical protein